ncbi:MAG: glycosyltransferase [Verrucomicrobia bacterium]|nr:glycosyltransferase [Verrucomicrobiota bacterium]
MNRAVLSRSAEEHLARIRTHYNSVPPSQSSTNYLRLVARYYNQIIPPDASVLEIGCGSGQLLHLLRAKKKAGVDISERQIQEAIRLNPDAEFFIQAGEYLSLPTRKYDYIVISDTLNYAADVQQFLQAVKGVASARTRLVANFYNSLWRPLVWLGTQIGLRPSHPESNWLAKGDVASLMMLTGWELIKFESRILCPIELCSLDRLINKWLAPVLPGICLSTFVIARPGVAPLDPEEMSVSVVVPARNEAGNIQSAMNRIPTMGKWTEIIFVEGHSRDNTWEEIRKAQCPEDNKRIKILKQSGTGKGNAVREGFAIAEADILMILDADLTMPPEELRKYFEAMVHGRCEFANGSRLVYPMQDRAMKFLNLCANKTFSLVFSWLLGQQVKDTLCGTKALFRSDYQRLALNRSYFGDFDPFGDFDLLFGASRLNLKIVDIPIRYCDRTYGTTNIRRWAHGWLLLRMVLFAAKRLKFI